jgi:hypothetical protein
MFKKGDLVVGLKQSDMMYKWTNSRSLCKVDYILPADNNGIVAMYVEIVGFFDQQNDSDLRVEKYSRMMNKVDARHFRKATRKEITSFLADLV